LVFTNRKERKCSIEPKLINNSTYDNKLNKFVTTIITYKNVWKVSNFDTKYESFADAAKLINKSEEQ